MLKKINNSSHNLIGLEQIGWNDFFAQQWDLMEYKNCLPARVVADYGTKLTIAMPEVVDASVSGVLLHKETTKLQPKVGDWVAVSTSSGVYRVRAVLPRKSEIVRQSAHNIAQKQILATNVDKAFLVVAADNDFSINRLQRYIFQLGRQNIEHIVVLNKIDTFPGYTKLLDAIAMVSKQYVALSALDDTASGLLSNYITPGNTAVFLGSSGVGKSTLTNALLGSQVQSTGSVRTRDGKGRHTTVHRELFILPNGGLIIDTPGIRELQIWGETSELDESHRVVMAFAKLCKFNDCSHTAEPQCAVNRALKTGELDAAVYANYQKMRHELERLDQSLLLRARTNKFQPIQTTKKSIQQYDDNQT